MVTKRTCNFCGMKYEPGTGKMLVDAAGAVSFYCSSKCEKNVELKRKPRKIKWTNQYRAEKEIRVQHLKGQTEKAPEAKAEPTKKAKKK